jgi:hypothetical protein
VIDLVEARLASDDVLHERRGLVEQAAALAKAHCLDMTDGIISAVAADLFASLTVPGGIAGIGRGAGMGLLE